jgi:outer membrane murein-binding lipoprotein Lpp
VEAARACDRALQAHLRSSQQCQEQVQALEARIAAIENVCKNLEGQCAATEQTARASQWASQQTQQSVQQQIPSLSNQVHLLAGTVHTGKTVCEQLAIRIMTLEGKMEQCTESVNRAQQDVIELRSTAGQQKQTIDEILKYLNDSYNAEQQRRQGSQGGQGQ